MLDSALKEGGGAGCVSSPRAACQWTGVPALRSGLFTLASVEGGDSLPRPISSSPQLVVHASFLPRRTWPGKFSTSARTAPAVPRSLASDQFKQRVGRTTDQALAPK